MCVADVNLTFRNADVCCVQKTCLTPRHTHSRLREPNLPTTRDFPHLRRLFLSPFNTISPSHKLAPVPCWVTASPSSSPMSSPAPWRISSTDWVCRTSLGPCNSQRAAAKHHSFVWNLSSNSCTEWCNQYQIEPFLSFPT